MNKLAFNRACALTAPVVATAICAGVSAATGLKPSLSGVFLMSSYLSAATYFLISRDPDSVLYDTPRDRVITACDYFPGTLLAGMIPVIASTIHL